MAKHKGSVRSKSKGSLSSSYYAVDVCVAVGTRKGKRKMSSAHKSKVKACHYGVPQWQAYFVAKYVPVGLVL